MEADGGTQLQSSFSITEEEAKLYDRQIRLWGLEAQNRMRNARVLLIGFRGLNSEVCKNLVLSGVQAVTILEDQTVAPEDLAAHLFLSEDDIGKNRGAASVPLIQQLNPLVEVQVDDEHVSKKAASFFHSFTVVCATNCTLDTLLWLDHTCRDNGVFFFAANSFGQFSYFFEDLAKFRYTKKEEGDAESKMHVMEYSSLEVALTTPWQSLPRRTPKLFFGMQMLYAFQRVYGRFPQANNESDFTKFDLIARERALGHSIREDSPLVEASYLRELMRNASGEMAPICAITGGILAQEIIKVISAKEEPFNNFFFYSGILDTRQPGNVIKVP